MRKIVWLFVFCFCTNLAVAQNINWLAWDNIRQHNPLLPAQMKQDEGFTLTLPGLGFSGTNSGPAIGDFLLDQGNGVFTLDFNNVINDLDPRNDLQYNLDLNLASLDLRRGSNMFSLGYGIRARSNLAYSRDLILLYEQGNAGFIGESLDLSHQLEVSSFHQVHFGYVKELGAINLGARVKYIAGISDISTPRNDLSLFTSPDIYQLSLTSPTGITFNSTGGVDYNGLDDVTVDFDAISFGGLTDNKSIGLDLGIYGKSNKISYALSALDIGNINWSQNSTQYSSEDTLLYEGFDLLDFLNDENDIVVEDSLLAILDLEERLFQYSTGLGFRINAMFGVDISEVYGLALVYSQNSFSNSLSTYGLINKFRFGKQQLNLSLSSTAGSFNVGLGGSFSAGPLQIILSADNILGVLDPDSANYSALRIGTSLSFGKSVQPVIEKSDLK